MQDNLGLTKGHGFSQERMDLFKAIIDRISQVSIGQDRPVLPEELDDIIPAAADEWKTIDKAIEFYAVPNGICIVEDLELNGFYRIRTADQYADYSKEVSDQIEELQRRKNLATAAWLNDRRGL